MSKYIRVSSHCKKSLTLIFKRGMIGNDDAYEKRTVFN